MAEINFDEGKPIRGDILKKAFDKFDYLGISAKQVLIEDLEVQGMTLDDRHYYRLKEIENRFISLFGKDVTPLLVERLKRILSDLKWQSPSKSGLESKPNHLKNMGDTSSGLNGNLSQYTITVSTKLAPAIKKIIAKHLDAKDSTLRFDQVNDFIDKAVGFDTPYSCRHILLVYEEIESARKIEMRYLKSRLQKGETCMCLAHSDNIETHSSENNMMRAEMTDRGIDIDTLEKTGQLAIMTMPNSESLKIYDGNKESVNEMYLELVSKLWAGKKPPFAGFGLMASEQDLKKPKGLATQLQLEQIGGKQFERFDGTWVCPYHVDDIFESLEKDWMKELLLHHDAVIYVRRNYNAIALMLPFLESTKHLKTKAGKERISNVDHILIPSNIMRAVMEAALNVIMPDMKQQIIADMIKGGIRLDDETAYYSLSQIRDYLHLILGSNGAEVLADVLRSTLEHTYQFEKYG